MTETREVMAGFPGWAVTLFYVLATLSTGIFVGGLLLLARKYRNGRRGAPRSKISAGRIIRTTGLVFSHASIRRRSSATGLAHLLVFYGFLVLFAGTTILAINDHVTEPLGWDFWVGPFYLGYSLFLDLFGAAMTLGLVYLAWRRWGSRPARLDYRRPDGRTDAVQRRRYARGDALFIGTLFGLVVTGFLLEGLRIAIDNPSFELWSPVGWSLGQGFRAIGISGGTAEALHMVMWWIHALMALAFIAAIPFTKALHMIAAPASLAVRDDLAGVVLAPEPMPEAAAEQPSMAGDVGIRAAAHVGAAVLTDLSWSQLIELDACTKCGKCHEACPANAGGYPLSPRDLVLDLHEAAEGALGIRSFLNIEPVVSADQKLAGGVIRADTLWACTTCMACVDICPVGIEHVPLINQMRRTLVDDGVMDTALQGTLETIFTTGNSFGEPKRKRGRWAKELPFPVKDIRKEPADVLWFLGDYASLDPRNQRATQDLARVLRQAGIDHGTLYDAERNAGCDVRRVGEEGLFNALAEQNIEAISKCSFQRIVTSDPHSFHTLKNEYPALGGRWTVLHHTQLLLELLRSGALIPARPLDITVTYHDPCKLGRYNGIYEEPREILAMLGVTMIEMPRNRSGAFCCGAGGGRIWMKDAAAPGSRRPAEQRIDEAVALGGVDRFLVACPKDVTMYEDAIKTSGHEGEISLIEISELVWLAVAPEPEPVVALG